MNRDPGMNILNASVNSLRLELIGSGPLIKTLRPDQIRVTLDLGKGSVGENTFSLKPENITLPPGVFLKNIKPDTLQVTLDAPGKKAVPLQVDWVGKLPDHLVLSEVKLTPETVYIVGGQEILKNVSTIYTKRVPLDKIQKSGTLTVGIDIGQPSLKPAPGSKDTVTVNYTVAERQPVP
ncbi:MAG: CdaR family protein [Pseudomonadota bacterium]